jgi:phosphatidylinositol 4-kinase A
LLPAVKDKIIESFTPEARDMFEREFDFFDKVTSISGVLFPLPKDERRAGIRR